MAPIDSLKGKKIIFVLGGPGSGKGTQCERLLAAYPGLSHFSSGDLLRAEVASGSERGNQLKAVMERGELVSLQTVLELIRDAMVAKATSGSSCDGFLVDGFPRELDQGTIFESQIAPCTAVLYFDVSEEVMEKRLLHRGQTSGRVDDNAETIKKRFATFKEHTKPVIDHYKAAGKVVQIDASGSVDEVFAAVQKQLGPKL